MKNILNAGKKGDMSFTMILIITLSILATIAILIIAIRGGSFMNGIFG